MGQKRQKNQWIKSDQGVPSLLTPEQVSELFNLKVRQVTELARQGRIPAIKLGRLWRFSVDSLKRWIEENQNNHISQTEIDLVVDDIIKEVNNNSRYSRAVRGEF